MSDPTHTPRIVLAIFAGALIVVPLLLMVLAARGDVTW